MATVYSNTPQLVERVSEIPKKLPVVKVPIKVGIFGGAGSGKTTSAALLAAALSKEIYGGAPIMVTDTEPGWHFLKRRVLSVEGVELIQRTVPTFRAMLDDIREAEKLGCAVYAVDSLTVIWQELMESFKKKNGGDIPINVWGDLKFLWAEYTSRFLNSPMCCIALGRLANDMSEIEDEKKPGRTKLIKTGTKFKAGGGESFGYEPHLLLELSLEKKAKRKAGVELEGEGRMVHRVDVLKDRTWALNGKVIRWSDKPGYVKGGYRQVWESLKPHYEEVQATMALVMIGKGSSEGMISDDGNSEYYERRQRRDCMAAEIKASLDLFWGGQAREEKQVRIAVNDLLFGVKSREAADALPLEKLERGLRILHGYEKRVDRDMTSAATVLTQIAENIREYDTGTSEEWDLPSPF